MGIIITYSDIINKVKMLSSYEGRDYAPDGDNQYIKVKITTQDEPLIKEYISTAINTLLGSLLHIGYSISETEASATITYNGDNTRTDISRAKRYVEEAIVANVMASWLAERRPTRVDHYSALYTSMLEMALKTMLTKTAPTQPE